MDSGNLAWLMTATALVLLMTPGVAFFYGGLVKAKSVVSMMMMSFGALGLTAVLWVLYGSSMSAVDSTWAFAGNPFADFGLATTIAEGDETGEVLIGSAFGATFAIITVALISGAIADRAKFGAWMIFAGIWATLVYFPVAAWVWGGGWIEELGTIMFGEDSVSVIDYAGGTVVHINAGAAALALAIVLGKRVGFQKGIQKPHNVPLVLLGAALLWFGWFGFNGGAVFEPLGDAGNLPQGLIVINTMVTPAAAVLGWIFVEKIKDGKPTAVGAATGAVSGLVAITPACADLDPVWAIVLGLVVGAVCALAIELKWKLGYDDSLDVVGVHLVGGIIGALWLGFFARDTGLIFTGSLEQLIVQFIAVVAALVYAFVVALIIGLAIEKTIGFRVKNEDEIAGVDVSVHGEEGYALTGDDR
ncbi:ammonium transporter [Microbacterium amylolyticum]|uniref:Ammonium transporter n=1 Tax=Microbacterium amylolyticum TaxID=936337 RepID=A0ABS4ZDZ5_9MICO|nr:ammonium transporter [Microbacterium amylolyticum]MBP2435499.1 Amt family ammonium transporter [Microbacterium amylolyticum]